MAETGWLDQAKGLALGAFVAAAQLVGLDSSQASIPAPDLSQTSSQIASGASLLEATHSGDIETVKARLKAGADVHEMDDNALRVASDLGKTEIVKVLLKAGADPNAEDGEPLRLASYHGYSETVQVLLKAGANVHPGNDIALKEASESRRTGDALKEESYPGHLETVQVLLKAGASAEDGEALQGAEVNNHREIANLLRESMANNLNPAAVSALQKTFKDLTGVELTPAQTKAAFTAITKAGRDVFASKPPAP